GPFPATLTTPALNRRSLRWFGLPACTANPEDLPPSLAQHGSCRRPSTSPHSPFGRTADRRFPHYGCVSGCNGVKIAWNHEMSGARRGQSIGQGLLLFRTPAPAVHREGMCPRTAAGT